jgi:hypothetical protein
LQLLQLLYLTGDLHRVPAMRLAGVTSAAGINAVPCLGFGQQVPGHVDVAVLHGIHMRSHQCRDIDPLRAIFTALAALPAELGLSSESLAGEEFLLGVGVWQVANHGKVLVPDAHRC